MSPERGPALRRRLVEWCRAQPGVTEERPFGPDVAVYKVAGKMFAVLGDTSDEIGLKCDPAFAEQLRRDHPERIRPGYHLNKRHWNSVRIDGGLPAALVQDLVEHSYTLVVDSLPLRVRAVLRSSSDTLSR